jgi:hypothetical protein
MEKGGRDPWRHWECLDKTRLKDLGQGTSGAKYLTGDGGLYKATLKVAGRTLPGQTTPIRNRIDLPPRNQGFSGKTAAFLSGRGPAYFGIPERANLTVNGSLVIGK